MRIVHSRSCKSSLPLALMFGSSYSEAICSAAKESRVIAWGQLSCAAACCAARMAASTSLASRRARKSWASPAALFGILFMSVSALR